MTEVLLQAAVWGLVITFAWSAAAKLVRLDGWRAAVRGYGFTGALAAVVVASVPLAEASVVVLLVTGHVKVGAAAIIALLAGFSLAVLNARAVHGDRLPCGCFGGSERRDYRVMLLRNVALGALAAIVLLSARRDGIVPSLPQGDEVVAAVLVVAGAVLIVWLLREGATSLTRRRRT